MYYIKKVDWSRMKKELIIFVVNIVIGLVVILFSYIGKFRNVKNEERARYFLRLIGIILLFLYTIGFIEKICTLR
jgi:hypothetical protein